MEKMLVLLKESVNISYCFNTLEKIQSGIICLKLQKHICKANQPYTQIFKNYSVILKHLEEHS